MSSVAGGTDPNPSGHSGRCLSCTHHLRYLTEEQIPQNSGKSMSLKDYKATIINWTSSKSGICGTCVTARLWSADGSPVNDVANMNLPDGVASAADYLISKRRVTKKRKRSKGTDIAN